MKSIFQLHGVNAAEQPVLRKKFSREQMIKYFEKSASTTIALDRAAARTTWRDC
ncbi:hypothetical protein X748_28055 [Mesorhizobium sp. LNJC386A00]|nr:hypothetical protein X748_28055 [Mesorhizobium sp. LNJC386A00]